MLNFGCDKANEETGMDGVFISSDSGTHRGTEFFMLNSLTQEFQFISTLLADAPVLQGCDFSFPEYFSSVVLTPVFLDLFYSPDKYNEFNKQCITSASMAQRF